MAWGASELRVDRAQLTTAVSRAAPPGSWVGARAGYARGAGGDAGGAPGGGRSVRAAYGERRRKRAADWPAIFRNDSTPRARRRRPPVWSLQQCQETGMHYHIKLYIILQPLVPPTAIADVVLLILAHVRPPRLHGARQDAGERVLLLLRELLEVRRRLNLAKSAGSLGADRSKQVLCVCARRGRRWPLGCRRRGRRFCSCARCSLNGRCGCRWGFRRRGW